MTNDGFDFTRSARAAMAAIPATAFIAVGCAQTPPVVVRSTRDSKASSADVPLRSMTLTCLSSSTPAFGPPGTPVTVSGIGLTSQSTVSVASPSCGTVVISPGNITRSLNTNPQTLTFPIPNLGYCMTSGALDFTVSSPGETTCGNPSSGSLPGAFILAAPGQMSLSRRFASTTGGTQIHIYNGGCGCEFTAGTSVTFGGVAAQAVTMVNANDLLVTTPALLEGAPVTVAVSSPPGSCSPATCAFPSGADQFEPVQYGFSTDKTTNANAMPLFRSGDNPSSVDFPLATDERHTIDGRPFPSIPISAISDVDLFTQGGGFLKRAIVVEQGKTVRLWNSSTEAFTQQFPAAGVCPLSYWSPKRVAADPDARIAYVLQRRAAGMLCSPSGEELPAPINLLQVSDSGISLFDRPDTDPANPQFPSGFAPNDYEIQTTNTFANSGFPVDAEARVTLLDSACPSSAFDGNIHKWQNAGYFSGLSSVPALPYTGTGRTWKSRWLVVTQSSIASDEAIACPPTIPPGCTPGVPFPPGCGKGGRPPCVTCVQPPCPALFLPLVLAVYDLNPYIANQCTAGSPPTVRMSAVNPHYLKKRTVVYLGQFLGGALPSGTHYEIGLSLSGANSDQLFVAAPLSGKLLNTTLSSILTLGDAQRTLYNDQTIEGDITLPSSSFIDLVAGNAGSLPTGVVVMNDQSTGFDFLYVPLAGTEPNEIQKRRVSSPTTVTARASINDATGSPGLVFPAAIAARDQGDKVFTANFVDGSISPIPGDTVTMGGNPSVPVGTSLQRIVIQKEVTSSAVFDLVNANLVDPGDGGFDIPPHEIAILGEVNALGRVIHKKVASPNAVDAQVAGIIRDVDRWVIDTELANELTGELSTVASLYRQEQAAGR